MVCSYDVVDEAYSLECGHIMHNECFDAFLQLGDLGCDYFASAQWYFSNGDYAYEGDYTEADHVIQESGCSEAPSLSKQHDHDTFSDDDMLASSYSRQATNTKWQDLS